MQWSLGELGFLLAAVGYTAFFILLLTVKTNNAQRHVLSIYVLISILWGLFYSIQPAVPYVDTASFLLETSHKMLLALFLLLALQRNDLSLRLSFSSGKNRFVLFIGLGWLVLGSLLLTDLSIRLLGALLLTITLLAMIEALYRQAAGFKWQFKPLVVALGLSLLLDFYLLAEASLLGNVNLQTWQARGYVHLVLLPFLVVAVKRIKSWGINVYVSRDIVLQSSLLLAAGIYLCVLALVGYYLSYVGGNWTSLLQVVFVVAGTAILGTLLFSHALRRKGRVFIEKHFFANTFDYREKWVGLTHELKQIEFSRNNTAQVCLQAWCNAIGYSHGAILKLQNGQLHLLHSQGKFRLDDAEQQVLLQLTDTLRHKHWLYDLSDRADHHAGALLEQCGYTACQLHFSICLPIYRNTELWGLCLLGAEPTERLKLNWELRDYLGAVSEQISSYLFMDEASRALSENAQFAAFSRMSAFVVHDLKNVKAQIDMLLKNAERHRHNPEFIDDTFETIAAMQNRLQHMLSQLMQKQSSNHLKKLINISSLVRDLIDGRCMQRLPHPQLIVQADVHLEIDAERFSNILFHLIDNAQCATTEDGQVTVTVNEQNNQLAISITDNGCGMTAEFIRTRLFKPFDTTKGNAGMGIGAYDALNFVEQSGGQLTVDSIPDEGTTFKILLPLH